MCIISQDANAVCGTTAAADSSICDKLSYNANTSCIYAYMGCKFKTGDNLNEHLAISAAHHLDLMNAYFMSQLKSLSSRIDNEDRHG